MDIFRYILAFLMVFIFSCSKTDNQKLNKQNLNEKQETKTESKTENKTESGEQKEDTLISVIGVGDIMMGTNYPSSSSLPPDDGVTLFNDVKDILESGDITFGNLEGTLLNSGGTPKKCKDEYSNCISFRMPEHYASYIKDAGFDVVSVANNHSGDMGDIGRQSTMKTLEAYGIKYAGYTICSTTIIVKDGIKFGFTAFAPNVGTNDLNDIEGASQLVSELKKHCDILILSFHGGAEGTGSQRVTGRREIFLGEDRGNVLEFAHAMVDAGADIIFGQGPHVTRAIEIYKDKLIAYSLGNFCTYGKFGLSGPLGLAPILKLYINKKGDFVQGRIFPTKQLKRGGPLYDQSGKIISIMQTLTKQDFPGTPLEIDDDGKINLTN